MHYSVLLFTGHLIDSIDRIPARFPYRLISEISRLIAAEISIFRDSCQKPLAISSLAAGSDMLFAAEVLERGIPLHAFLPFSPDEFIERSVRYVKNHIDEDSREWTLKFREAIRRAAQVTIASLRDGIDPYAGCNQEMLRQALLASDHNPEAILALAVLEPDAEIRSGGSADFVRSIEAAGIAVRRLWPLRPNRLYR